MIRQAAAIPRTGKRCSRMGRRAVNCIRGLKIEAKERAAVENAVGDPGISIGRKCHSAEISRGRIRAENRLRKPGLQKRE